MADDGQQQQNYSNPSVAFFHVFFKGSAIAFYVLCSFFVSSFIIQFVVTVLLVALDFWVVKNVSGRILVGLRWWNEIDDRGESVWRFESLDQQSLDRLNKKDTWLFWWTLYIAPAVWLALGLIALIKFNFDYLLIVGICLTLGVANIIGFTKCRRDAKKQFQSLASQVVTSNMASRLFNF